ncbi:hypothetical protein HanPSC8_Chr05g0212511 [Helianthus annuus]|nr:hypothetical protein HanPSC8_Chr05g0212511 [Helianthus annuus]
MCFSSYNCDSVRRIFQHICCSRSCIHTFSSRLIVMRHLLIRSVIPHSEYKPILVSISFTKSMFLPFKKHAI